MSSDTRITASTAPSTVVAGLVEQCEALPPNERLRLIASVWASLPPSHPAAGTDRERELVQRCLANFDAGRTSDFPWETISRLMAGNSLETPKTVYSVPRRFDLPTVFVVTLAYSLLFGAMSGLSFPPAASLSVGGFFTLIAASQALLFGGKRPRVASILVGSVIFGGASLAIWIADGQRIYPPFAFFFISGYTLATGAIIGYLAGTVVGGIFLVADKCRKALARNREPQAGELTGDEAGAAVES